MRARGTIALVLLLVTALPLAAGDDAAAPRQVGARLATSLPLSPQREAVRAGAFRERAQRVESLKARHPAGEPAAKADEKGFTIPSGYVYIREAYGDTYFFMSDLKNTGSSTSSFVKITLNVVDVYGLTMASDSTYVFGSNLTLATIDMETDTCLHANETGFWGVYIDGVDIDRVASFTYSVDSETYSTTTPHANVILTGSVQATSSGGDVKLTGTAKNTGSLAAAFVRVACALKESNGDFLDVGFTFIDGSNVGTSTSGLQPNETGPFDLYSFAPYAYYGSYSHKTAWDDYGSGTSCTYSISPSSRSFGSDGGTGTVSVTTTASCSWTASSASSWIHITAGGTGTGSGTVTYAVDPNSSSSTRTGTVNVAGQVHTVTQTGVATCTYSLSPTSLVFGAEGGGGTLTVTTTAGCPWSAQSSAAWIELTGTASGSGSGQTAFQVQPSDLSTDRTGSITVQGQVLSITQHGRTMRRYYVPGVAHLSGAGNTTWRSDLVVCNPGSAAASVTVALYYPSGMILQAHSLDAGSIFEWRDVVASVFQLTGGVAGTIRVDSDSPLVVSGRTYNDTPDGTYGQYLPGVPETDALEFGDVGILTHLKRTADFRTNVGFVNLEGWACGVRVTLISDTGDPIGSPLETTVQPNAWTQFDNILALVDADPHEIAYAEVRVLTPGGRVWACASVIDGRTGDPMLVPVVER